MIYLILIFKHLYYRSYLSSVYCLPWVALPYYLKSSTFFSIVFFSYFNFSRLLISLFSILRATVKPCTSPCSISNCTSAINKSSGIPLYLLKVSLSYPVLCLFYFSIKFLVLLVLPLFLGRSVGWIWWFDQYGDSVWVWSRWQERDRAARELNLAPHKPGSCHQHSSPPRRICVYPHAIPISSSAAAPPARDPVIPLVILLYRVYRQHFEAYPIL